MPPTTRSATARSNANATGREPAQTVITNDPNNTDPSNANNSVSSLVLKPPLANADLPPIPRFVYVPVQEPVEMMITVEQAHEDVAALLPYDQMEVEVHNDYFNDIKSFLNDIDREAERLKCLEMNTQVIRKGQKRAEEIFRSAGMLPREAKKQAEEIYRAAGMLD